MPALAENSKGESNMSSAAEEAENLAIETLMRHIAETKNNISTVSVDAIDWPDASLGCPKEGLFYPQVITPGYRVELKAGNTSYRIHTAKKRAIICDKPGKQKLNKPSKKLGPLTIETLTNMAKIDLAYQLRVNKEKIKVSKINEVNWTDSSLGCPQGKREYKKENIPGYVIHLELNNKTYTYHSDKDTMVFACPAIASM